MNYRIYPIMIAEEVAPGPAIYYLNNFGENVSISNFMWLIKGGKYTILVDSGFTQEMAARFEPGVSQKPEQKPSIQLKKLGVRPEDITHLILTHSHYDHLSSCIFEYKKAQIIIQKREMEFAGNPPHPWFLNLIDVETVRKIASDYGDRLLIVEDEFEVVSGISVFWTGGHTPGHQSVAVSTSKGKAILTGDVAFTYKNIEDDIPVGVFTDLKECYLAMARIRNEADIILPGHEPLVLKRHGSIIPDDD